MFDGIAEDRGRVLTFYFLPIPNPFGDCWQAFSLGLVAYRGGLRLKKCKVET
jgi:hypothetical protein